MDEIYDLVGFIHGDVDVALDRENKLNLYRHDTAVIIGCGGIGSWIAFLSSFIFKHIILIDHDSVEITNLHRTPFFAAHVFIKKVNALAQLISLRNPSTDVIPIDSRVENVDLDYLIEETTNSDDVIIFDCRDTILPPIDCNYVIIRLNYDGFNYSVIFNPDYKALMEWDDNPETAGYQITPSCQSVPVMLASFVLQLIQNTPPEKIPKLKNRHRVVSGNINDLLLKIFKS